MKDIFLALWRKFTTMIIYFRACEKQATISNVARFNNIAKVEMLKRCWSALQSSVRPSDTVIIIADEVHKQTLEWMLEVCNTKNVEIIAVPEHEWSNHLHTVVLINTLEVYAKEYPDLLHYLVEDDYLHTPNALSVLETNLSNWGNFAVSYDYPDRYHEVVPCQVILGYDRHWRTVTSSTMTILAKGSVWLRFIPELKIAAPTSNDQVFKELFKQVPCISPIPGVSSHMTDRHWTPYINWGDIWDKQNIE